MVHAMTCIQLQILKTIFLCIIVAHISEVCNIVTRIHSACISLYLIWVDRMVYSPQ